MPEVCRVLQVEAEATVHVVHVTQAGHLRTVRHVALLALVQIGDELANSEFVKETERQAVS